MKNEFYRTENFNEEVVRKFAEYLDANDLYIIKCRPHGNVHFVMPQNQEKREELLKAIIDTLNNGFYSNDSCINYLYELVKRYQDDYVEESEEEKNKNRLNFLDFFQ